MGARPVCPKLLQGTLAGGLERGTRQQQPITTRTHGAMRHLPAGARTEQQLCRPSSMHDSSCPSVPLRGLLRVCVVCCRDTGMWLSLGGFQETGPDPEHL
jgi:hypothetical protein